MQNSKRPRFLIIGGFASSLINFRGPLLKRLVEDYDVYAAAPFVDDKTRTAVESIGVTVVSNRFNRTGINPIQDTKAYFEFKKQINAIQPEVVLAYTIKPVIFGLRASKGDCVKRFALITGKGSGFESKSLKSWLVSQVVRFLYRSSLKNVDGVIFQNVEDQRFFKEQKLLASSLRQVVIEGTGVDLEYYKPLKSRVIENDLKFLFIARLIKEKGIPELIEATKILKNKGYKFETQLLGWVDPNPGGISESKIQELHNSRVINYLGTTDDVRPYIDRSDVFILPSYYNEGLPRTIQEAMAMKKPIITTNHPGCRETVEDGQNGFLVPIKNPFALSKAMECFILNPEKITLMGEVSYRMAKEKFEVGKINEQLITFMTKRNV